jgi:hypothetical protein
MREEHDDPRIVAAGRSKAELARRPVVSLSDRAQRSSRRKPATRRSAAVKPRDAGGPPGAARTDELKTALRGAKDAEGGADAGVVLAAAGALLRRSQSLGVSRGEVDAALKELPRAAALAWLESESVEPAKAALALAIDEAIEAALADTAEERSARAAAALAALAARDRLESSMAGLARYEAVAGALATDGAWRRDRLAHQVEGLDASVARRSRALAAVNAERRRERDLLDGGAREAAWWYASRADCDALARMLSGKSCVGDAHVASCAQCSADVAATASVEAPLGPHLTSDELWKHEAGELGDLESRRVARHAERCSECALALSALADGERALLEEEAQ